MLKTLIGDSLVVQDAQTLVITLAQPAAYFLQALTYPTSYAVPQNVIKQYGAKWVDHIADNGGMGGNLFKLTEWDHAGNIKLVRNDSFWGTKPKLREMDFTIYKSSDTAYNTYLAGQGDVGFPPTAQLAAARTRPDFHEVGQLWIDYYLPNWKISPFDDVRVRQAFALALDKNALANNVLHGAVIPTNHIVPQDMPGYNADLKGVDGGQGLTGNTTQATQLAQQYANEKCGGSFANCPPVTLTYSTGSQDELNQDQAALAMWQKSFPGWKIKISGTDFNTLITQENTRTLQFWSIAWVADYPDAQDWLSLQFLPTAQYNDGSANVPDANALMTKADSETDQAQRIKDYNAAEQLLVTNVAWIPLYQVKLQYEARQYVKNFTLDAQAFTPLDVMQNVYIAKH